MSKKKPTPVAAPFPAQIVTMRQTWDVKQIDRFIGDETLQGQILNDEREIHVKRGQAKDAKIDTLLHESVHAYQEINRLALPDEIENSEKLLEDLAQWMSACMIDLLRSNPALVKAIVG